MGNNITIIELRAWLDCLNHIPVIEDSKQTFFSMTGLQHYENAWSNIYAYFLNPMNRHGLGDVFMRGLEKVIERKQPLKKVHLNYFWITRERSTDRNNRIDLLIQDHNHKIIIENKVYHSLVNDLDDYWDSIKGDNDAKTGIVLTLSPMIIRNSHYINITHVEWLEEVKKLMNANSNISIGVETKVYLDDFMKTAYNITADLKKDYLKFYFENRVKINMLFDVTHNTKEWLQSIFTKSLVKDLHHYGKTLKLIHHNRDGAQYRYAMFKFANTNDLVVTIFYEDLWNSLPGEAKLRLFLEPMNEWLKKAIEHKAEIDTITKELNVYSVNLPSSFWHCAVSEELFDDEDLSDSKKIREKVISMLAPDTDLMKAADRIIDLLSK